jgi:eukaryotic-like serine/threonine-protein kinase
MKEANVPAPNTNRALAVVGAATEGGRSLLAGALQQKEHAQGELLANKYQILGPLGAGGMGTVWRAHSLWLDVGVAIKVLHREQVDVLGAERLLREARATARIGHPAIVRVFDFGQTDTGQPFLVMELLEGISLATWLNTRGPMSPAQAVQMLLPIAGALAAAHARGIVHRDIKPANIIAVRDEAGTYMPKIVDFGIAKLSSSGGRALTQTGTIIGSPEYMSPEQANGMLPVGEQTDVWALCVLLYELITGQRPFGGVTLAAIISAVFHQDPTPASRLADCDEDLWKIIERGLKKSPGDRWPSMRALGRALASWAAKRGITTDAAGMSLTHHWLATEVAPEIADWSESPSSAVRAIVAAGPPTVRRSTTQGSPVSAAPSPTCAGTVRMAYATNHVPSGFTLRRRSKATLLGLVAAFLGPLVIAAGFYAHRGNASATASDGGQAAATTTEAPGPGPRVTPSSAGVSSVTTSSIDVSPAPAEAPSATASVTDAKQARARDTSASPAARPKISSMAMPLPTTPDF